MNQFQLYFNLGIQHILDLKGFDHILFVLALAVVYMIKDWGRILVLVTAFTIGHSLTLALATLKVIQINTDLVEFLIPVTIAITALSNIFKPKSSSGKGIQINYLFALCFGLIHGLGFSNYLTSLLGKEQSIFTPLLAFNIGLEIGQVVIVVLFLLTSTLITGIFRINRKEWVLVISSMIFGMAIMILLDSVYW
ncbi:HupE/UreJ family protein [Cyclobacterium amurskyense]|uniref:HupE / UreJ protein n=1 Tax=Cyclobacterium amurskyense TaxID=320787 RepID=A0A0H4PTN0_9BACT|nr:HupE/UreJ family protein [Cyclobacterium amurskyense]AKP51692.1 HupE / UreJ protein [Cyclobacterium amurskyense]|tara:strand:- start:2933 stop:3514 length:582 start_codon:yes stop_codon:yes gene_type:complete